MMNINDCSLDYEIISVYVDFIQNDYDIATSCEMLNQFWVKHCEVTKTFLFIITYTKNNHIAKKMWYDLRNKLNLKIKLLEDNYENFQRYSD